MAKVSDGYTIGAVSACIRDVITCKRMLQLRIKPLTHVELINALSIKEPVYREEEEAFLSWWAKVKIELNIELRLINYFRNKKSLQIAQQKLQNLFQKIFL